MRIPSAHRESEVLKAARELVSAAGITTPPVDVELLARMQGVRELLLEQVNGADAELSPVDGGYIIRVDPRAPPTRRRFSIAHEVAHTFFGHNHKSYRGQAVTVPQGVARGLGYRLEESLCDHAAAEMIMPKDLFLREAHYGTLSVGLIGRLAATFQTSVQATAIRHASLINSPAQITIWRKRGKELWGNWRRGPPVIDSTVISLDEPQDGVETVIAAAYTSNSPAQVWELDGSRRVLVDARPFGSGEQKYVLSILQSAKFA